MHAIAGDHGAMKDLNCSSLLAGEMPEISTEAVRTLASDPEFVGRAISIFGPEYRLRVVAVCRPAPGWTVSHFQTSDEEAVPISRYGFYYDMPEDLTVPLDEDVSEDEAISLKGIGGTYLVSILSFRNPESFDSWHLEYRASALNKSKRPVTILPDSDQVTIFPRVQTKLKKPFSGETGPGIPETFPKGFICLLELWQNIELPSTDPPCMLVFRLKAKSPISATSQWESVVEEPSALTNPDGLYTSGEEESVTRFYVRSDLFGPYHFERIYAGGLYHYIWFLSS